MGPNRRIVASRSSLVLVAALALAACATPPPQARAAQERLHAGDLRGAEAAIDEGLVQHPRDASLWNLRIRVRALRGDNSSAVASWREWRGLDGEPDLGALRAIAKLTLWNGLKSESPEVRVAAVEAAWALDDDELAEPVAHLLDDDDEVVRASAAAAILRSHPDAPTVLTEALHSPEARARRIAIAALGDKVGAPAHDDIAAGLADKDASVRAAACVALGKVKNAADAPRLLAAVRDADGSVRASALRALADVQARSGVDAARGALADPYLGARLAALELLDRALGDAARGDLEKLAAGADGFMALRAGVLLAKRGVRAPGAAALERALADKEWTVRAAAANAAVPIAGKDGASAPLARLAADAELAVRLAVARAYISVDRRADAARLLGDALAASDEASLLQATIDLERLADARAAAAWDRLLGSTDAGVREQTVVALRTQGPLANGLVGALADASWKVRVAAAWTILARR
jgi:HEAT repeat protein